MLNQILTMSMLWNKAIASAVVIMGARGQCLADITKMVSLTTLSHYDVTCLYCVIDSSQRSSGQ